MVDPTSETHLEELICWNKTIFHERNGTVGVWVGKNVWLAKVRAIDIVGPIGGEVRGVREMWDESDIWDTFTEIERGRAR